jgi:hypothetical protein
VKKDRKPHCHSGQATCNTDFTSAFFAYVGRTFRIERPNLASWRRPLRWLAGLPISVGPTPSLRNCRTSGAWRGRWALALCISLRRLDSNASLATFIENIRHRELILAELINNELTGK